jgi:ankyrin repeat protein
MPDDEGRTALMLQFNDKQTVRSLLDAGADLEAKDQKGWTALMYAVDHLYEEKVAVLLEAGANVNAAGRNGETALTIAARYRGNQEIARLLKRAGAR